MLNGTFLLKVKILVPILVFLSINYLSQNIIQSIFIFLYKNDFLQVVPKSVSLKNDCDLILMILRDLYDFLSLSPFYSYIALNSF